MSNGRDPTSRLRQTLNPLLTTSLGGYHNQLNTPASAISLSSPYTFSNAHTPASAIQPYDPREWVPSPAVGPDRHHTFPLPAQQQEPQGSPLPPPPYSPPRSSRPANTGTETSPANISAARIPPSNYHRPSPEPQPNPSFPPPPGTGGRGASRERRFGIPSLSRRRDRDREPESLTPPDPHPPTSISRAQPLSIQIPVGEVDSHAIPPSARRAASASAIETPTSARSRSTSQSRWEPGMPLPPPPPGPPPGQPRSQSLSRTTEPMISPPTRRPPPGGVMALGPVPPTPADWVEESHPQRRPSPASAATTTDDSSVASSSQAVAEVTTPNSAGGLARTGALRGDKTIIQRRNESRTRQPGHSRGDSSTVIRPLSEIMVPGPSTLARRVKTTPRSGRSNNGDESIDSRTSTPRASAGLHPETPTPPFSPHPQQKAHPLTDPIHHIAPKSLPTPPPQSRSASTSQTRPELLHSSTDSLMTKSVTKQMVVNQTAEQFSKGTIERFQSFAQREASAGSDAERVRLFADFIVNESRIRRERYSSAIGAMGSEIFDLSRDLFRPMTIRRDSSASQSSEWTPQMSETRSQRNSFGSIFRDSTQKQKAPDSQPNSAPPSAGLPLSPAGPPNNANWSSNYMPSLSPILSMSVSEAPDEGSSRGRPSSRWWEADSVGGSPSRLERSKRESKYMGVPKEAWYEDADAGPSNRNSSTEYPPEKVGWHESEQLSTPQLSRRSLLSVSSQPNTPTPNPSHLDVSRLVTLPPPYPRHHPAVNNNHPDLTSIRTSVRSLTDLAEIETIKSQFVQEGTVIRQEASEAATKRVQTLRQNLQEQINQGHLSYADAAAIDADSKVAEAAHSKELEKKIFDLFQTKVVAPVNETLTSRIAKATNLFDELRSRLFVETQAPDPNMPQEEGDEQPELLEKLTLLKWIFEAREQLHREIYDLLSDRNDRYKDMVITPYRNSGNEEKVRNAQAFFAEDAAKRKVAFTNEVCQRTREFRDVISENVLRGVEVQMSAFWDIAEPLSQVLEKIPPQLKGFNIQIPASEFEENPSYFGHPMQYLYSLLLHAEKSTHQFIESQTNLQCLLHEVKEAVVASKAKVMEASGEDMTEVDEQRKRAGMGLTEDLKGCVRDVREQWESGLGGRMRNVKERVGEWLLQTGGWDESLEDGGVGSI